MVLYFVCNLGVTCEKSRNVPPGWRNRSKVREQRFEVCAFKAGVLLSRVLQGGGHVDQQLLTLILFGYDSAFFTGC